MVCNRCIKVVEDELVKLGIQPRKVTLGEVELPEKPVASAMDAIKEVLENNGFEMISNKQTQLVEKIKTLVISEIHHKKEKEESENFSNFISRKTGVAYSSLSKLFSSIEGMTLEQYIIHQKIEKAKELLVYGELTLSQIAWELDYSSVQHLSSQFKKVTGLTPSHFKKIGTSKRKPLDKV